MPTYHITLSREQPDEMFFDAVDRSLIRMRAEPSSSIMNEQFGSRGIIIDLMALKALIRDLVLTDHAQNLVDKHQVEYSIEYPINDLPFLAIATRLLNPLTQSAIEYASIVQRLDSNKYCFLSAHSE